MRERASASFNKERSNALVGVLVPSNSEEMTFIRGDTATAVRQTGGSAALRLARRRPVAAALIGVAKSFLSMPLTTARVLFVVR